MKKNHFPLLVYLLFSSLSLCAQSFQSTIDSLQLVYQSAHNEQKKIDLLNDIAYAYRRISPDSIMLYANQAIERAENIDYKQGLAFGYKNRGIGYFKLGASTDTIISHYKAAIYYAESIDDYYTQAACYNNIGLLLSYGLSAYNEAAWYFLKGLAIFEEHIFEEKRLKALILANIGVAFHSGGDNKNGIQYLEDALAMADRLGELSVPSIYVAELAKARIDEGDIEGALRDIIELMPLHDQLGDYESKVKSLLILSEIKIKTEQYADASAHANEAIGITKEYGFPLRRSIALTRLALGLQAQGRLDEAAEKALLALENEGNGMSYSDQMKAVELLVNVNARNNNYHAAYEYNMLYKDLIAKEKEMNRQHISDALEIKYQNEYQLREIESLKKERENQKKQQYRLIALVLASIIVSAILIYNINQKNKATTALNEKNKALKGAEQSLNEKNKQLERYIESNLQLENFAHLASHDLREPMRNIVSFSQLLAKSGKSKLDEHELEYLDFIQQGTGRIEGLVQDLLAYSTISHSPLSLSTFSLSELIEEVKTDIAQILTDKKGEILIEKLPEEIVADRSRMYQLFQNLLTNALRYNRAGIPPAIRISTDEDAHFYHFQIRDNGKGIAPQFYEQIFVLFKSLENKSVTNSSGIGLATCRKVAEDHQGEIWVESVVEKGSTFHFTIAKGFD